MDTAPYGGIETNDLTKGRQKHWACADVHGAQTLIANAIGTGRHRVCETRVWKSDARINDPSKPHVSLAEGGRQLGGREW